MLTWAKEESYPLPISLLSKDFDPVAGGKRNALEEEQSMADLAGHGSSGSK